MGRVLLAADIRGMETILLQSIGYETCWKKSNLYRFSLSYYPSYFEEQPVPLTEQLTSLILLCVSRDILAYIRLRIFWVNWNFFDQHKTECGQFYSKKNLGNTKASKRKFKICHMEKVTDCKNLCILILNTNITNDIFEWERHREIYSYHYMGRREKK